MTRLEHPGKRAKTARYYRARGRADVAETIEAELAAAGRCKRCGRILTDPQSLARGVGAECWSKERPAPEPHHVVPVVGLYGQTVRAYCTKPGCPWVWDGIGAY